MISSLYGLYFSDDTAGTRKIWQTVEVLGRGLRALHEKLTRGTLATAVYANLDMGNADSPRVTLGAYK